MASVTSESLEIRGVRLPAQHLLTGLRYTYIQTQIVNKAVME